MLEKVKRNQVTICGKLEHEFEYNHAMYGQEFYRGIVRVERTSGMSDYIPVIAPKHLIENICVQDKWIQVSGEFRTRNMAEYETPDGKKHVMIYLYADFIEIYTRISPKLKNINQIYLEGTICKEPIFRVTPHGRWITDLCVAVNRPYRGTDYLPCIAWEKCADEAAKLRVGNRIRLNGRVQSRTYIKRHEDGKLEKKEAYEVSLYHWERVFRV